MLEFKEWSESKFLLAYVLYTLGSQLIYVQKVIWHVLKNIHDAIPIINFGAKIQMRHFIGFSKSVILCARSLHAVVLFIESDKCLS
mgnify:CR=1 FL=1